jgi:hypothetical protein
MFWILIGMLIGALVALGRLPVISGLVEQAVDAMRERTLVWGERGAQDLLERCSGSPELCPTSVELLLRLMLISAVPALVVLVLVGLVVAGQMARAVGILAALALAVLGVIALGPVPGLVLAVVLLAVMTALRILVGAAVIAPAAAIATAIALVDIRMIFSGQSAVHASLVDALSASLSLPNVVPPALLGALAAVLALAPLVGALLLLVSKPGK